MDRRLLEVSQIHGNLRQTPHQETSALYEPQSSTGKAHCFGDLLRDIYIGGVQKDVVGDQEFARTDDRGACGGMHPRLAEVGLARRVGGDVRTDAFKLAAPDVLEI